MIFLKTLIGIALTLGLMGFLSCTEEEPVPQDTVMYLRLDKVYDGSTYHIMDAGSYKFSVYKGNQCLLVNNINGTNEHFSISPSGVYSERHFRAVNRSTGQWYEFIITDTTMERRDGDYVEYYTVE